jgi:hypothetical protein
MSNNLFVVLPEDKHVMYAVSTKKRPFFYYWFEDLPRFVKVMLSTIYNLSMKSLENYKDPSVHDIIQFITNTTYCLYMQPSDRKDYEFYIRYGTIQ